MIFIRITDLFLLWNIYIRINFAFSLGFIEKRKAADDNIIFLCGKASQNIIKHKLNLMLI